MKRKHLLFLVFLIVGLVINTPFILPVNASTTVTFQVGSSTDDVSVTELGVAHPPWDAIESDLTFTIQKAGQHPISSAYYGCGSVFNSVTIPQGATITNAFLNITSSASRSGTTVNTIISGEDADDSATFSDITDFNARTRTSANISWSNIGTWVTNSTYASPNITIIIQEIVDRVGWSSGNNMTIFWEDDEDNLSTEFRRGWTYDKLDGSMAMRLTITYTSGQDITQEFNESLAIQNNLEVGKEKGLEYSDFVHVLDNVEWNKGKTFILSDFLNVFWSFELSKELMRQFEDEVSILSDMNETKELGITILNVVESEIISISDVLSISKEIGLVFNEILSINDVLETSTEIMITLVEFFEIITPIPQLEYLTDILTVPTERGGGGYKAPYEYVFPFLIDFGSGVLFLFSYWIYDPIMELLAGNVTLEGILALVIILAIIYLVGFSILFKKLRKKLRRTKIDIKIPLE